MKTINERDCLTSGRPSRRTGINVTVMRDVEGVQGSKDGMKAARRWRWVFLQAGSHCLSS
jgi:hypothetical protein